MVSEDTGKLTKLEATYIGSHLAISAPIDTGEILLQIISGTGAGKEFTFAIGQEVLIGRQEDSHIFLNHNLVSRNHSKIEWQGGEAWIVDLNSTNGIALNKKKIKRAALHEGDRIKVGNSVMKISFRYSETGEKTRLQRLIDNAEELLKRVEREKDKWGRIFSGSMEKIRLAEILQSIAMGKSQGILVVRGPELGKIYLREGKVFFAKVADVTGQKALFRMLSWQQGNYELRDLEDELIGEFPKDFFEKISQNFSEDMTQILLEYFKSEDEFSPYKSQIPRHDARFSLNPQKSFSQESGLERVYQIYKKVGDGLSVREVLNHFPLLDTEIYRVLLFLLERNYLIPMAEGS